MGVFTLYKYLDYDTPGTSMVSNKYSTSWSQRVFQTTNRVPTNITLRSVTTLFDNHSHGFYRGFLHLNWFRRTITFMNAQDQASADLLGTGSFIDLRWDGASRVVSYDCELSLGDIDHELTEARFLLEGTRTPFGSSLIFNGHTSGGGGGNGPTILKAESDNAGPFSISLTFTYD